MIYDYIIVGGGPTGITLATMLTNTTHTCLLLDSESSLGGNWKIERDEENLFTEHSPKVLFTNNYYFYKLLSVLGVRYKLKNVYDDPLGSLRMVLLFLSSFSFSDHYKLIKSLLVFVTSPSSFDYYLTMHDWIIHNDISTKGKLFLETLAVVMANRSDKICMGAFFEYILIEPGVFFNIVQLQAPNNWIAVATKYLRSSKQIQIQLNTHIVAIQNSKTIHILRDSNHNVYRGKRVVLTVPIRSLYDIISNSSNDLQKNWFNSMTHFKSFIDNSSYVGIGFQLHFDKIIKVPVQWCWSCFNDWKIIVVQKDYINKNDKIKSVWSCVIVDLESKSKTTHKTANECNTINELLTESLAQLSQSFGSPLTPTKITYHKNIRRANNRWDTINSSYANCVGALPYKGRLVQNLFSVGPHNIGSFATVEQAVKSAIIFGNNEKINTIFQVKPQNTLLIIFYLIVAYIAVYSVTYKM